MNYGFLDVEMTCDGKMEDGKFIDDGRMKRSQREIISVGFVVCDDKYNIKGKYSSFVKPVHNSLITEYCEKLTGITQNDVDRGKKCNNAFRDIRQMCDNHSVNHIFTFGQADKFGIIMAVKWNKKEGEKVNNLHIILKKIIDVSPKILKSIGTKNPGLSKIAEELEVKIKGKGHEALNDALLLCKICRKLSRIECSVNYGFPRSRIIKQAPMKYISCFGAYFFRPWFC